MKCTALPRAILKIPLLHMPLAAYNTPIRLFPSKGSSIQTLLLVNPALPYENEALAAGWFVFLIVAACFIFKAYVILWPGMSWVSYKSHSFPGYLRATPELNSSSTEGTNILWPFISYCA